MALESRTVSELRDVARVVRAMSQTVDNGLLVVGDRLSSAVDVLGALTRRFESLPEELETDALRAASTSLEEVSKHIPAMADALVQEKTTLSRLSGHNQVVGASVAQLKKTVSVISVLAMNAQIESAHINMASEDFAAFAKEIVRLSKKAEATIEDYIGEHAKLAGLLAEAGQAHERFLSTQDETMNVAGQKLAESLRTIETRRRRAADVAAEIGTTSKNIGDEIGAVVMGLQIGDTTRQRLEHVVDTLEACASIGEPGGSGEKVPPWAQGLAKGQHNGLVAVILRMESAQLEHAAKEFDVKLRKVVGSLHQLDAEASGIVRLGGTTFGSEEYGNRSFLEDLEESLRRANGLISQCEAARRNVDAVIATLAASLDGLLARITSVKDVETEMRLVGLNTALKCGRLGSQGRTLSVISHELRAYANQTVEDADKLTSSLKEISKVAEQFKRDRQEWSGGRLSDMKQRLAASCDPFLACGARVGQALDALSTQGRGVGQTLDETASDLRWHTDITQALKSACGRLSLIAANLPGAALDEDDLARRLESFSQGRYTMASERGIHGQFATKAEGDASAASPADSSPASLEDILF
jgi:uncharacterized protein YukE